MLVKGSLQPLCVAPALGQHPNDEGLSLDVHAQVRPPLVALAPCEVVEGLRDGLPLLLLVARVGILLARAEQPPPRVHLLRNRGEDLCGGHVWDLAALQRRRRRPEESADLAAVHHPPNLQCLKRPHLLQLLLLHQNLPHVAERHNHVRSQRRVDCPLDGRQHPPHAIARLHEVGAPAPLVSEPLHQRHLQFAVGKVPLARNDLLAALLHVGDLLACRSPLRDQPRVQPRRLRLRPRPGCPCGVHLCRVLRHRSRRLPPRLVHLLPLPRRLRSRARPCRLNLRKPPGGCLHLGALMSRLGLRSPPRLLHLLQPGCRSQHLGPVNLRLPLRRLRGGLDFGSLPRRLAPRRFRGHEVCCVRVIGLLH